MEVLTGEQMRRVDRHAIETLGIPGIELMEAAGRGVAEALLEDHPDASDRGVAVLCGKGNNGGDGFVAARYLAEQGLRPRILLFGEPDRLRGDAAANYRAALDAGLKIEVITDSESWNSVSGSLRPPMLILDALLGTGVQGGARGLLKEVIEWLNGGGLTVLSVDLPSGADGDDFRVPGVVVRAAGTYTLCRPKLPLVTGPAGEFAGNWRVLPIGIPDESVATVDAKLDWLQAVDLAHLLPPRAAGSHKGTYGHLLAVAGSRGKAGAAVLVGRGALRCGAGLVTVATAESARPEVASQQAELMTEPLRETGSGGVDGRAAEHILSLLEGRDALALGPGLGTGSGTRTAVFELLERIDKPAVIDADGLNAIALGGSEFMDRLAAGPGRIVLTPHPGEAARLLGSTVPEVQDDRLAAAVELSDRSGSVVVLKGHRTVIARPGGRISVNSTGNPGMGTAGTGDVLTGMIGAFLARGIDPGDAAALAVFLHGLAGDIAAVFFGQEGLIASDVLERVPRAVQALGDPGELERWSRYRKTGTALPPVSGTEGREEG